MDKSNNPSESHNSVYQKLEQVEHRRQTLKLSFPTPTKTPIPLKPVVPVPAHTAR
jgi:hypothetical protein